MTVALFQQPTLDRLAGTTLEEHIVGHDDRGAPVDRQQGPDVLQEIELLIAGDGLVSAEHDAALSAGA
jgi:hypothetical protein